MQIAVFFQCFYLAGGMEGKRRGMEGRRGMEEWIEGERENKEGREGGRTPWSLFFKDTNPMVVGPPP